MSDLQEIRDGQQQLLEQLQDTDYVAVSDIKNYFIPDWALSDAQAKKTGSEQHERHEEEAEQVARDEAWDQLGDEFAAIEWPVLAQDPDNDTVVVGKIDAVHFQDGRPDVALERKYPKMKNLDQVYESEQEQAVGPVPRPVIDEQGMAE